MSLKFSGDQAVDLEAVNFDELQAAFKQAPREVFTFLKQDFSRFGNRFIRSFKSRWLSGPPGIKGGPFKRLKDKNARAFVSTSGPGEPLQNLRVVSKLSRILATHARGAVIVPKRGEYLVLSRKTGKKGRGHVFARVKSVKIPARLGFVSMFATEVRSDLIPRILPTVRRAVQVSMERKMKSLSRFLTTVTRAVR